MSTHIEYQGEHPCAAYHRTIAKHERAIGRHAAKVERLRERAKEKHERAVERARKKDKPEPDAPPFVEPPDPKLDLRTTGKLSELDCANCRAYLVKYPQVLNAMRCADLEAGTAQDWHDVAKVYRADQLAADDRAQRAAETRKRKRAA